MEAPESEKLPCGFDDKFSIFQRLLILRILRPDRVSLGVDRFIVDRFKGNSHFVEVIYLKPEWLLSQANAKPPSIYILSQGADPSQFIRDMAKNNGFVGKKFLSLSLGQNMEETAENMVETGAARGYWVLLQNCDLLPDWLKSLEKLLEKLERSNVDFKLWLTTRPTKEFPLGIL